MNDGARGKKKKVTGKQPRHGQERRGKKRKSEEVVVASRYFTGPGPSDVSLGDGMASRSERNYLGEEADHDVGEDARSRRLGAFFDQPCTTLAQNLLGHCLVRIADSGERLSGKIVETEAYLGAVDRGAHSYNGKFTERTKSMFLSPGTAYVYWIHGIYSCLNVVSSKKGAAVLIRSLEPLTGLETMRRARGERRKDKGRDLKDRDLCSGPSKLCQALCIDKNLYDRQSLVDCPSLWVEEGPGVGSTGGEIVTCPRIGIAYAGEEWAAKPLRYYLKESSRYVSVRNKEAESQSTGRPSS